MAASSKDEAEGDEEHQRRDDEQRARGRHRRRRPRPGRWPAGTPPRSRRDPSRRRSPGAATNAVITSVQASTRGTDGSTRGAGGERGDHDGHDGVAGEEHGDGGRHGEVALAVGDPVGVGAVAGDRVADPVTEPPHRPGRDRGDAERHDRDPGTHHRDAGAVTGQPGERTHPHPVARGAVDAGVGGEPADHADREQHDERTQRRERPAERRDQHQRARAGSVGPRVVGSGRGATSWPSHHHPVAGLIALPRRPSPHGIRTRDPQEDVRAVVRSRTVERS